MLQGVVEWASKDPADRQKWLHVLIENIDLEFLKSKRNKWLAVLEEKQLLLEDVKNIIYPAELECNDVEDDCEDPNPQKMMRHNALEEVSLNDYLQTLKMENKFHI